ncbi:hypothetical protein FJ986_27690 [Mesorhizobium sp. B1-1-1]|uniref:hypothetical protein n=1 Tax=Mesorhizobium sp. B1-1-1 TaxID=2589983 RepID=UPI001129CFE1|nr:hypothetical protein [Mesorhizobium sp. B1-1-1]TPN61712.1 hypothetical protein FJ986_27690 [Mesorhizobium sp. B1-1-1]
MSLAADALQPFFVPGLINVEGRPDPTPLADLVGKQRKIGFDLDFDNAAQAVLADFRDTKPVLNSYAYDCSRLAASAFQSMRSLPDLIASSEEVAWGLIRSYYASFYAGHSLMRIFGTSCSHFDRNHVAFIINLGLAYGKRPTFQFNSGLYQCAAFNASTAINMKAIQLNNGGTHETFWKAFSELMKDLAARVLHGPLSQIEAQSVYVKLDSFQKSITSGGLTSGSWLSAVRNEVQYRNGYGAWLPVDIKKHHRETLSRLGAQWKRDPMEIDVGTGAGGQIGEFVVACAFVVALCRTLLTRMRDRSPKPARSFASLGPLSVLRLSEQLAA